jgi:hypothetical protein
LTATRSMRFVTAWYSTRRTVRSDDPSAATVERSRFTSDESSLSTRSARRATSARRASGKGTSRVLGQRWTRVSGVILQCSRVWFAQRGPSETKQVSWCDVQRARESGRRSGRHGCAGPTGQSGAGWSQSGDR